MRTGTRGFTIIELMIAVTIIAIFVIAVTPKYFGTLDKANESVLKHNLLIARDAIDKFFTDRGRYPRTIEELVTERYLRAVPIDPITKRNDTWTLVPPPTSSSEGIFDIRSSAMGKTDDGVPYDSL